MRIILAVLSLDIAACLSLWSGDSRAYVGLLALTVWFLAFAALPPPAQRRAWSVMVWASVGCAAWALVQLPWLGRPTGPFGSPNYLGAFAAVMAFVAWQRVRGPARYAAVGANLLAVAFSQSRGAILAVGAGLCASLGRRRPILSGTILLLGLALAIFLQRAESRLAVWELALVVGLQRPLTGWGLGGMSSIFLIDGRLVQLDHFYSVPLDWFVATGLVGVAVGGWMTVTAWRLAETETRAILASWAVTSLFLSASWPMWIVLFAILAGLRRVEIPGDEADAAAVVDHREPLADRGAGALRPQ